MTPEDKYKPGDIIKRNLTSRQSWTVQTDGWGNLVGIPNNNKFFTDKEPIELTGYFIKIAQIGNIKFG